MLLAAATLGAIALVRRSVRGRRNLDIAALGAQVGGTYATTAARKLFATAERRVELDRERELRTAEAITDRLGNMKGALMKLGQMASYVSEGLPEPMRAALAELQSNAPPMSAELAAGVDRTRARCAAREGVRRVGSQSDRVGQHRPGPPRRRRRSGDGAGACRRREGAVSRCRRGDRSGPSQRQPARRDAEAGLRRARSRRHGCRDQGAPDRRARLHAGGRQPAGVRRLLPRPSVHPRARRAGVALDVARADQRAWSPVRRGRR